MTFSTKLKEALNAGNATALSALLDEYGLVLRAFVGGTVWYEASDCSFRSCLVDGELVTFTPTNTRR